MYNNDRTSFNNIALFIDIENLIRCAIDVGLPVSLDPINKKLLETGRIAIRRAFGDLDAACRGDLRMRNQVRRMMLENLIQFEDIPYATQHKNTADMRLVVDALSTAYTYTDLNFFAIVSSDRDYAPLIAKLRELGRHIIGVGVSPDTVNEIYVKSCDQFIYYSALFPSIPTQDQQGKIIQLDKTLLDAYIQLFCDAIISLDQRGLKTVGAAIVPIIRQLRPDYDLTLVGFQGFRDLANEAKNRGLCKLEPHGGDMLITLTPLGLNAAQRKSDTNNVDSLFLEYQNYLSEKLRCDFPSEKLRISIYEKLIKLLKDSNGEFVDLITLSKAISELINNKNKQPTIFKVLYSLFRGKIFDAKLSDQPYNPLIKGAIIPYEQWDQLFIENCLATLKRDKPNLPLNASVLADLFGIEKEKMTKIIQASDNIS